MRGGPRSGRLAVCSFLANDIVGIHIGEEEDGCRILETAVLKMRSVRKGHLRAAMREAFPFSKATPEFLSMELRRYIETRIGICFWSRG